MALASASVATATTTRSRRRSFAFSGAAHYHGDTWYSNMHEYTHTHTTHRRSRNFLLRIMHSRYSDCFMLLCKNGPTCYLTFIRHLAELRCVVGIADTETPKGQWKSARERARVCARSGKMTRLHSSQFSCHRFASSHRRHRNLFSVVRVGLLYDGECECVRECVCTRGGSDSVKYLG